jgi:predicted AAA+ superfamily ATPase
MLQYIQEKLEHRECIYASLDNLFFTQNTLLGFVQELYDYHGVRYFFLDETHKYPGWNQEIKNIYDSYPDIKIVFSGSSSLDLVKGAYDLSRRGVIFRIGGLSFREYLLFHDIADIAPITLDDLLTDRGPIETRIAAIPRLLGHFQNYLGRGYYPFHLEDEASYSHKVQRIMEKTVYEDISHHYRLKTENLIHFKRILSFLATIPPGKINRNNIAKNIGLDNKTIQNYLDILSETGLVQGVTRNKAGSNILKNAEKIFLDNPDMYHAIGHELGFEIPLGTMREIYFIKMILNAGHKLHYSDVGDYEIQDRYFEIGGKGKSLGQIKAHLDKAFLVKDGILHGSKNEIPLYLFGFLY